MIVNQDLLQVMNMMFFGEGIDDIDVNYSTEMVKE